MGAPSKAVWEAEGHEPRSHGKWGEETVACHNETLRGHEAAQEMYPRALAKRTATSSLSLPVKTALGPRPPHTPGVYPGRRLGLEWGDFTVHFLYSLKILCLTIYLKNRFRIRGGSQC